MSYSIHRECLGFLSAMVACMETVNQRVYMVIDPSGLCIQSMDHDNTTDIRYTLPVETHNDDDRYSMVCVSCVDVLQFIQCVQGKISITVEEGGEWHLGDSTGHVCIWTNRVRSTHSTMSRGHQRRLEHYDYTLRIPTADLLLYIQHISLCESYVCVSSHGVNGLSMVADGELLSIQIQTQSQVQTTSQNPPHVVHCTFKYVRSVLSILQKIEYIDLFIIQGEGLFLQVTVGPGTFVIMLRDVGNQGWT
jgi:hypothetical protein